MSNLTVMAKLGVDASAMNTGLAEAKGKMDKAAGDIERSAKRITGGARGKDGKGGIFDGLLGGLTKIGASIFALSKVQEFTKGIVDMGGSLVDASDNLGISIERLQELQQAFGEAGVGAEKFGKGMSTLNASIEAAKGGDEEMVKNFEDLGVTFNDLLMLSPDEILLKISDATAKMGTAAEKTAKLSTVLGKASKSMVGIMSQGSDAINEVGSSMQKMSEENAKALDKMADDYDRWWKSIKGSAANAALAIAQSPLAEDLKALTKDTANVIQGFLLDNEKQKIKAYLGIGKPASKKTPEEMAAEAAEKAAQIKIEQERLFANEIAKFQKEREKQAEQTMLQHHEQRMAAEEQLAKRQEDAEKKVLDFRGKQKVEMRDLLHMMDQAKQIGGDIGGEFAAKAGQAKMDLVEAQTQRLLMSPAERVAADREARRVRHAQQKAQRIVERQIREGKIQDAAPAMQPMPPEAKMGISVDKFGGFVNQLVEWQIKFKNQ